MVIGVLTTQYPYTDLMNIHRYLSVCGCEKSNRLVDPGSNRTVTLQNYYYKFYYYCYYYK